MAAATLRLTLWVCGLVCTLAAVPPVRFATMYQDHMVLQQLQRASVWGYAPAGTAVVVTLSDGAAGASVKTTASSAGTWHVLLPAVKASFTPNTLAVADAANPEHSSNITDVLFGDVWLASGQSNQAFSVAVPNVDPVAEAKIATAFATDPGASPNGTYISTAEAIAESVNYPFIRLFVVGDRHDCTEPIPDFYPEYPDPKHAIAHNWSLPSPDTIAHAPDVMGSGRFSATAWFFGMELFDRLNVPIGLVHTSYGGSAVEDWMSAKVLGGPNGAGSACPGPIIGSMGQPTQQYNGQIHPLLNMTIKGVIWYQGESNHGQNELYTCRFQQMMAEWRREWHVGTAGATDPNFWVGFVQIGPLYGAGGTNASTYAIRMGQTAGYGYAPNPAWPRTFMATAFDLANPPGTKCFSGCVHIFNKQAVSHRLAVAARKLVYLEQGLVYSGPRLARAKLSADGKTVAVAYGVGTEGKGLALRNSIGFETCTANCSDLDSPTWRPANIASATATTVTVDASNAGGKVLALRYGYAIEPSVFTGTAPAVYNGEGLPATPGIFNVTQ